MPATSTTEMFPTESAISNKVDETASDGNVHEDGRASYGLGSNSSMSGVTAEVQRPRWQELVSILVCLEVGVFLFVAPWSPLWAGNLMLEYSPAWQPFFMNAFVRGAFSGLGLLNLWFAFHGVWNFRDARSAVEPE